MIKYLNPEGTFLVWAIITFSGSLFYNEMLKETQGLSDIQKKQLYWPDKQ